jgi:hypothetical protein
MVLTTVSDTRGKDGSAAPRRRRSNGTARRPVWPEHCRQQQCTILPLTTKAPKPRKASAGEESIHLWAASRPGRRQSHSLRQQSHPARFVAGAGILWRVSTHKGSPLFRRRAPAPNTVDRKRSPGTSQPCGPRRQETARGWTEARRSAESRRARFEGAMTFSPCKPSLACAGRAHRCRRERALGSPAGRGRFAPPSAAAGVAEGDLGVSSPWGADAVGRMHDWMRRACPPPHLRPAACPCSPGSGCKTRTRRSCRCAGASARRTAGSSARAAT